MDDLAAFVSARLDEDEELIRRNGDGHGLADGFPDYRTYSGDDQDAADDYIERFGPARAFREAEAGRRILARHSPAEGISGTCCTWCSDDTDTASLNMPWPCPDVRDLLSRWSDDPGYRPEWSP